MQNWLFECELASLAINSKFANWKCKIFLSTSGKLGNFRGGFILWQEGELINKKQSSWICIENSPSSLQINFLGRGKMLRIVYRCRYMEYYCSLVVKQVYWEDNLYYCTIMSKAYQIFKFGKWYLLIWCAFKCYSTISWRIVLVICSLCCINTWVQSGAHWLLVQPRQK